MVSSRQNKTTSWLKSVRVVLLVVRRPFSSQFLASRIQERGALDLMALSQTVLSSSCAFFGVLSFILGLFAELKEPPYGTPVQGKDVIICKFPSDPSVALGVLSAVSVFLSAALGILSVFFPYKGKFVPRNVMFQNNIFFVFFQLSVGLTLVGGGMMLMGTIQEALQHINNVHQDLKYACPTAKNGLLGGAAFLNLDASLFWLVCLMLTMNVREDYFGETEGSKDEYTEVSTDDNEIKEYKHTAA